MTGKDETYHALLMEYASGCLDEAHALVIAAHMALSPQARKIVSQYESIGGAMLHDCCTPVAMKADALQCVMAKLETVSKAANPCANKPKLNMTNYHEVPVCLERYTQTATWKDSRGGYQTMHIRTTCSGSTAEMVKLGPGATLEPRTTVEITLVLQGDVRDHAQNYTRGDLILIEDNTPQKLSAAEGAVFFVVRPSSSSLRRMLKSLLSRF